MYVADFYMYVQKKRHKKTPCNKFLSVGFIFCVNGDNPDKKMFTYLYIREY